MNSPMDFQKELSHYTFLDGIKLDKAAHFKDQLFWILLLAMNVLTPPAIIVQTGPD